MLKHFRAIFPLGVAFLLVLQLLYISQRFDAYTLVMEGATDGWRVLFGYLGKAAKIAVLYVALLCLLLQRELRSVLHSVRLEADIRRVGVYLLPQLLSYWVLLQSSLLIFEFAGEAGQLGILPYLFWFGALITSLVCWLLMIAPIRFWLRTTVRYRKPIVVAALVTAAIWLFTAMAGSLWGPLSTLTFVFSSNLLAQFNPQLVVVEPSQKILGMGDFLVSVAPACSGYEGVGLISAFLALYLYLNRKEFRFPRAFVLFPLGVVVIWLLNVVRIAVLVALGYYWSADVAIGGFHSQAGWILFILTSFGLLWFASHWRFVMRADTGTVPQARKAAEPLERTNGARATAALMPLIVLLAADLLTSAFSSEFIWLYPVRVIAVLVTLAWFWPVLRLIPYRPSFQALGAGVGAAVIWVVLLFNTGVEADQAFSQMLRGTPELWSGLWLAFRFLGAAVTVPIAEELAFRGYLLCKLSRSPNYTHGALPWSVTGVLVSSLAFGALHGAWVAGTIAGLIYAYVRLRSRHVGDAITAHATTNLLVFIFAAYTGQWSMI